MNNILAHPSFVDLQKIAKRHNIDAYLVGGAPKGATYPRRGLVVRMRSIGGVENGSYSSYSLCPARRRDCRGA